MLQKQAVAGKKPSLNEQNNFKVGFILIFNSSKLSSENGVFLGPTAKASQKYVSC